MTRDQLIEQCNRYLESMGSLDHTDAFVNKDFIEAVLREAAPVAPILCDHCLSEDPSLHQLDPRCEECGAEL